MVYFRSSSSPQIAQSALCKITMGEIEINGYRTIVGLFLECKQNVTLKIQI